MRTQDALETLGLLASQHLGLVTTKQAEDNGVSRLYLQRLQSDGVLTRMRTGVNALPSSVPGLLLDVYSTWLFLAGTRTSHNDLIVVSGYTAAQVHDIGEFAPDHYEFTVPTPRRTRATDISFKVKELDENDLIYIESMPVLSIPATLAQLDDEGIDTDHLLNARDTAVARRMTLEELGAAIRELSAPQARKISEAAQSSTGMQQLIEAIQNTSDAALAKSWPPEFGQSIQRSVQQPRPSRHHPNR